MKVKILTGAYSGSVGEAVKVDTSEGYPWVQVLLESKSNVWVSLDQLEKLEEGEKDGY